MGPAGKASFKAARKFWLLFKDILSRAVRTSKILLICTNFRCWSFSIWSNTNGDGSVAKRSFRYRHSQRDSPWTCCLITSFASLLFALLRDHTISTTRWAFLSVQVVWAGLQTIFITSNSSMKQLSSFFLIIPLSCLNVSEGMIHERNLLLNLEAHFYCWF